MNHRGLPIPMMPVGVHCATCPFRTDRELDVNGLKSGRPPASRMLWDGLRVNSDRPKVWDVWNLRSKKRVIEEEMVHG